MIAGRVISIVHFFKFFNYFGLVDFVFFAEVVKAFAFITKLGIDIA